ncbi:MAG: family 10 glycosylhydrolase [Spirochaetia bacterium]
MQFFKFFPLLLIWPILWASPWGGFPDIFRFESFASIRHARPYEELRGAWISTVVNIDWPIKNGTEEEQKELLIFYLEKLKDHNMNAAFFQIKPTGGAIYPSKHAPFAQEFTGVEVDKNPYSIDFLQFFITEAHKRNIEVHAWINPYRIATHTDRTRLSSKNFGRIYETLNAEGEPSSGYDSNRLITYGGRMYLDPGKTASQNYVFDVVTEVVTNYDVDAIHFDDYFYQYKVAGEQWPDQETCETAKNGKKFNCDQPVNTDPKKDLGAWRRDNANYLVEQIQKKIKSIKPYVKWGVSPFGVWRNSRPSTVDLPADPEGSDTRAGATSYDSLFADARLWYRSGSRYVDYLVPQVYWTRQREIANYETIVDWWVNEGKRGNARAGLYIGHGLYKAGEKSSLDPWDKEETIAEQIMFNREDLRKKTVAGSVFFTMHDLLSQGAVQKNPAGAQMMQYTKRVLYQQPAIIPPLATMSDKQPPPRVTDLQAVAMAGGGVKLFWKDPSPWKLDRHGHLTGESSRYYAIYRLREGGEVEFLEKVVRAAHATRTQFMDIETEPGNYKYAVASFDRLHNQSRLAEISVRVPVRVESPFFYAHR